MNLTGVLDWVVGIVLSAGGVSLIGLAVKAWLDRANHRDDTELSTTQTIFARQAEDIRDFRQRLDELEKRLDREQDYTTALVTHILADKGPPPPPRP